MIPTQIDKTLFPIIQQGVNLKEDPVFPNYDISEKKKMITFVTEPEEILGLENKNLKPGVKFDINRVSSKNARKSELGPYKTSFLREIILSHGMGKANGTKNELVSTILDFYEKKT